MVLGSWHHTHSLPNDGLWSHQLEFAWWQFLQEADPRCTVDCLPKPRFFTLEFSCGSGLVHLCWTTSRVPSVDQCMRLTFILESMYQYAYVFYGKFWLSCEMSSCVHLGDLDLDYTRKQQPPKDIIPVVFLCVWVKCFGFQARLCFFMLLDLSFAFIYGCLTCECLAHAATRVSEGHHSKQVGRHVAQCATCLWSLITEFLTV